MAINFPNTPVNGSTYDYLKVRYTYTKPNAAYEGYWRVSTPGSVGIATSAEIDAGTDDVKYVTPEGLESSKYNNPIDAYPVGACYLTMATHNPSTLFGGVWSLITGNASLNLGDGTAQNGNIVGDDVVAVPLTSHSHTRGTQDIRGQWDQPISGGGGTPNGASGAVYLGNGNNAVRFATSSNATEKRIYFQAQRNWTGASSVEGVVSPTLDVSGAKITINVWKRTA
jgi:hypothetical protein